MSIELVWDVNPAASALHAAQLVVSGRPLANSLLAETVRASAERLRRELASIERPQYVLWSQLICCLLGDAEPRQGAIAALRAAGVAPGNVERLADGLAERIVEIESVHAAAFPDLPRELHLRCGPLRQLWEERGPGLLRNIGALTGIGMPLPMATVVVAQPALGGGGRVFPTADAVLIEAVLANPLGTLPEVVRLGWLLAQLLAESRQIRNSASFPTGTRFQELALLPAVLEAAQFVELAHFDVNTLTQALATWPLAPPESDGLPQRLLAWWQAYRAAQPAWDTALAGLQRELGDVV